MSQPPPESPKAPESGSLLVGGAADEVIPGHKYDGIREYDNPMPGWWVWLFVITVVFGVVYFLGIEVFGFVDTYEDDLAEAQAELVEMRDAYAASGPAFETDERALMRYASDAEMAAAGAEVYAATCASCHGNEGQGLIGPNLTDDYWVHGSSNEAIWEILAVGVPAKGMPPWENVLSAEERAELLAFIRSIDDTDPAGAKEPEGELDPYEGA
ncbi:MAG: cbb3-type cytochrome c oxidase N-terminal domain-containing protein [Rhodothermales bacterium]